MFHVKHFCKVDTASNKHRLVGLRSWGRASQKRGLKQQPAVRAPWRCAVSIVKSSSRRRNFSRKF
jgi:hypothetical protein